MIHARLTYKCPTCGDEVDAPDTGFGEAIVAAFKSQHADHTNRSTT